MLKEIQETKHPFSNSNLLGMLDHLLEKGIIELPELKRPEEAGRTTNPEYCQCHRVVSTLLRTALCLRSTLCSLLKMRG